MSEMVRVRARYTGNKKVCYRWLGAVGGGKLVHAQKHPDAQVAEDTWLAGEPDGRMTTKTSILAPAGLLVVESEHTAAGVTFAAGLLTVAADPAKTIDWSAARHIEYRREPIDPRRPEGPTVGVHYVDVGGKRGRYVCEAS